MTDPTTRTPAQELAHQLHQLRIQSGMSGAELADQLGAGFSQSKISRIESGKSVPTEEDTTRLAEALHATPEQRRELANLAHDITEERAGMTPVRVALHRNAPAIQRRIREREERADRIGTFHPALVPGLLQSEGYMRAVIGSVRPPYAPAQVEEWLIQRRLRQAARSGLPAVQIVTEGALRWGVAGARVMADQCDHIARLIDDRPAWTIGVIPMLPTGGEPQFPVHGFDVWDDTAVMVGTTAGNALITDAPTVRSHLDQLDRLGRLAAYGDDAKQLLGRLAGEYRAAI